jgi:hypothetical protein
MEESPFEKYQHKTVILYVEPLLDSYNKIYVSTLTFNTMPEGPISKMVKRYNNPSLSPFQTFSNNITNLNGCTYILMKYPNSNISNSKNWMTADDIPTVFSFLHANEYKIDISLTKLMNHSQVNLGGISDTKITGDRRMVCLFSFPKAL